MIIYADHRLIMDKITYTKLNIILCIIALLFKVKKAYPVLFVNSLAILTSFHLGFFLDTTAHDRLLKWINMSTFTFWFWNMVVHLVPVIIMYTRAIPILHAKLFYRNPGFISAPMHFLWALFTCKSLNLGNIYIDMKEHHWLAMWVMAALTHLFVWPLLKRLVVRASNC